MTVTVPRRSRTVNPQLLPIQDQVAWLRDVPEAPGATNLNEIIERLAYVRKMQIDPKVGRDARSDGLWVARAR